MRMPEAADLLDLHFQRMVDKDPLESDDVGEIVLMIDIEAELGISSFRNDDTRAGMYFAAISLAIINF